MVGAYRHPNPNAFFCLRDSLMLETEPFVSCPLAIRQKFLDYEFQSGKGFVDSPNMEARMKQTMLKEELRERFEATGQVADHAYE